MILEGAIGDAYGAGFEFAEREKIVRLNSVSYYETHPIFLEIKGRYTDDTQMSIALAELLISGKAWTETNIANAFVDTFKRDPRRGYAKRFHAFLSEISSGEELLEKIINKSTRNGASMRAYVLGVISNEAEIIEKCSIQAEITHGSEEAIESSVAIALASHYFIYSKGNKEQLISYLNDIQKHNWSGKWESEVGMAGYETVEATLAVVVSDSNLKDKLKMSVDFGGDVDTVASLSLAISSLNSNVINDLPKLLTDELENGEFGKDYLITLDNQLKNIHNTL
jgi:ADP-ribosyl-[dinitrogen reductase] hydrolase